MRKNTVVCIGGMARTGSTFFCHLLAKQVGALNVGELIRLNNYRSMCKETICSCGLRTDECYLYANKIDNFDFRFKLQREFDIIIDNSKFVASFFFWLFSLSKTGILIYVFIYRNQRDVVNSIINNIGPDGKKNWVKAILGFYFWTAAGYCIHRVIAFVNCKSVQSVMIVNSGHFTSADIGKVIERIDIRGLHVDHQIDGNIRYRKS